MKNSLVICVLLILCKYSYSSHIVGGSLTYKYNGGTSYTVSLKLYRDCGGTSAAFPDSPIINVTNSDGSTTGLSTTNFTLSNGTVTQVTSELDSCATPPNPMPCVEEQTYVGNVNLPFNPGGYYLYYTICCRNASIDNIQNPSNIGEGFSVKIPGSWIENFTIANGTTTDVGTTAWTRVLSTPPPTSAKVNGGLFEVVGANSSNATWTSQIIDLTLYGGISKNVSVNLYETGDLDAGDNIQVYYSLDGGSLVPFMSNGQLSDDFTSAIATVTGLIGSKLQIVVKANFDSNSPSSQIYKWDNVKVVPSTASSFGFNNNSPVFGAPPPLFVCMGTPINANYSATDADNDSLVYSFYTPYGDNSLQFIDNEAVFSPVDWMPGYSESNPFNGSGGSAFTINSKTGVISGIPSNTGKFIIGVKVKEYRNGVLLSEVVRDYQFTVVDCQIQPLAVTSASICPNGSATLTANKANSTYLWSPVSTLSAATGVSVVASPTVTSTYMVIGTNKCITDTAYTTVTVIDPSSFAVNSAVICSGKSATLTVTGGNNYQWSPSSTLNSSTLPSVIATPTVSTAYTVVVGNQCGSPVTLNSFVEVSQPDATLFSDGIGCNAVDATAYGSGGTAPYTFHYNLNNSLLGKVKSVYPADTAALFIDNIDEGNYQLFLVGVTDSNSCYAKISGQQASIAVYPKPSTVFVVDPEHGSLFDPTVSFTDHTIGASSWFWNFGDSTTSIDQYPNPHTYPDTGIYRVQLIAKTNMGCENSFFHDVKIEMPLCVYTPNSFTPDGDGMNDLFKPAIDGFQTFSLTIYTRWGEEVFFTRDPNGGWNGRISGGNGAIAPPDTYLYKLDVKGLADKHDYVYRGYLNLIR